MGYWKLDETSSPALDYSGHGYNLPWQNSAASSSTVPTAPTFSDPKSLALAGTTQDAALATMPLGAQISLPMTLSAWFNATTTDTSGGTIISGANSYILLTVPNGVVVREVCRVFQLAEHHRHDGIATCVDPARRQLAPPARAS